MACSTGIAKLSGKGQRWNLAEHHASGDVEGQNAEGDDEDSPAQASSLPIA